MCSVQSIFHQERPSKEAFLSRMSALNNIPMTAFGLLFLSFLLLNVAHAQEVPGGGEGGGGGDPGVIGGGGGGQEGKNTL